MLQGKRIVNSISLKEGEEDFVRRRRRQAVRRGGRRDGLRRRARPRATRTRSTCASARTTSSWPRVNFPPHDIIFDPNILTIATGLAEHNNYGKDFIDAEWITTNLPGAKISGGVSNLSFGFRGLTALREAIRRSTTRSRRA